MSNYTKLKTNLKLAIQRLKLLGKKKTEQSLKSRKEIADYIQMNKPDRARIRVEHIIREDNMVEGLEMIEMFCDLLLARFGLIEKMKELDPGLDEAIATVIWASPRISNDVQEFKIISEIFAHKYGKKYADACKADSLNNVNDKVKRKLGVEPPPKILVENYLIEIAKNFNINYEPDKTVMLQSGQMDEELISLRDKTNEIIKKSGGNGGSGGASGGASGGSGGGGGAEAIDPTVPSRPIGFESEKNRKNLIDLSDDDDDDEVNGGDLNNNIVNSDKENPSAPPLPTSMPFGEVNRVPSPPPNYSRLLNAPKSSTNNVQFRQSNVRNPINTLPPYPQNNDEKKQPPSGFNDEEQAPPLPDKSHEFHNNQAAPSPNFMSMPPSYYQSNEDEKRPPSGSNKKAPPPADFDDDLGLPSVPDTHPDSNVGGGARGGSGGNVDPTKSIDFDDLARRFENLKSKK